MIDRFQYDYTDTSGDRQYDDLDISQPVHAIYVKTTDSFHSNPFIDALPRARTENELMKLCNKPVPNYHPRKALLLSDEEKLIEMTRLKEWRFMLPHQRNLENQFAIAQVISYSQRRLGIYQTQTGQIPLCSVDGSAPYEPFTLLDISGTGKSTSVSLLLNGYPQVILHEFDNGMMKMTQITYIYVVCSPNSNLSSLFEVIARGIDRALGYGDPVYQKQVEKSKTLGRKAGIITELINRFAIGSIIIDEIQSLDMNHTKESSINYLLSLVNESGVNLCIVGTEEGYHSVFKSRKIERRTGVNLSTCKGYYDNMSFFRAMVGDLWKYQWFDKRVPLSEDIVAALYEKTDGIVDDLVKLYMYMHKEYLGKPKALRPKVDAEFIRRTSKKYFPHRKELLDVSISKKQEYTGMPENKKERRIRDREDLSRFADQDLLGLEEEAHDIAEGAKLIKNMDNTALKKRTALEKTCIKELIETCEMLKRPYTEKMICEAVQSTMTKASMLDAGKNDIISQSFERLEHNKKKATPKRAKKDAKNDSMRALLITKTYGEEQQCSNTTTCPL